MPVLYVVPTATVARWAPDPVALREPPPPGHVRLLIIGEDGVQFSHYPVHGPLH